MNAVEWRFGCQRCHARRVVKVAYKKRQPNHMSHPLYLEGCPLCHNRWGTFENLTSCRKLPPHHQMGAVMGVLGFHDEWIDV